MKIIENNLIFKILIVAEEEEQEEDVN